MGLNFLFNVLQFIGGIILSFGYIPQIIKTFKTKKVEDLSLMYYFNVFVGVALMEAYSIFNLVHGVAVMFFITNTIALACCTSMLVLTYLYSRPKHIEKMKKAASNKNIQNAISAAKIQNGTIAPLNIKDAAIEAEETSEVVKEENEQDSEEAETVPEVENIAA